MSNIAMKSIYEVSEMLKNKNLSVSELVEECLKNTNEKQEELNAYITLLDEEAREYARYLDNTPGFAADSLLRGIPIALKDLYNTKGVLTSAGTKILSNNIPDNDSVVGIKLREAGTVLMGKTNTHEWAFGPTGENSYYGPTRNPWNPTKISGGSSGGSGVAVATGMAFAGMGTDTGGSIRFPAALCGIVGFKPSYGLVSTEGIVPLSRTLDHAGPITRSVLDAAIVMDAISGTKNMPSTHLTEAVRAADSLKGVRVGVPKNFFFDKADYDVERLVRQGISRLEELGAVISEVEIPYVEQVPAVSTTILFSEAADSHRKLFAEHEQDYQPDVADRLRKGGAIAAADYVAAQNMRDKIIEAWEEVMKTVDIVVAPPCPMAAYDIGLMEIETRGRKEPAREMCVRHTRFSNMTGTPGLSVPCGFTEAGLPVGMMIMGRRGGDEDVLKAGFAYEKHFPFRFIK